MIDSNHHHVLLASEICPVVKKPISRSAAKPATVQPDHDRSAPVIQAWRVDVDLETVFAHRLASIQRKYFRYRTIFVLRRPFADLKAITNAGPACRFYGRHETIRAGRRCGIRNTVELINPITSQTADLSGCCLYARCGRCAATVLSERPRHDTGYENACGQE